MRMKQQEANMLHNLSGAFAAIHAQPKKTPALVCHALTSPSSGEDPTMPRPMIN
jgi:hypothetical protein